MTVSGKRITRRKPGSGPSVNYFTSDTQDAIVLFTNTEDLKEREKIYMQDIRPAFTTLVENLINVYKFQVQYENKEDLKNECVAFLYGVITKFDPTKGSKAFSYFNVVAKNWLTIQSKNNAKLLTCFASLNDKNAFNAHELELIENYKVIPSPEEYVSQEEKLTNIRQLIRDLQDYTKTSNEELCLEAIELLFDNVEEIELINKRAVMVYIRNLTKLSTKQLSVVLTVLKKHYKTVKETEW